MITRRGSLHGRGKKIGIVVSRFNEFITKRLLTSAMETLEQAGVKSKDVEIVWVPGALEIPFFCKKLALWSSPQKRGSKVMDSRLRGIDTNLRFVPKKSFDALIALACILRGETRHFECVANEVTRGVSQVALEERIPIATGIITADRLEEAIERAGLKSGNKGAQAALAALEIADLERQLELSLRARRAKQSLRLRSLSRARRLLRPPTAASQ